MTRKRKEEPLYKLPIVSAQGHISGIIILDGKRYKDWECNIVAKYGVQSFLYNTMHYLNKIGVVG